MSIVKKMLRPLLLILQKTGLFKKLNLYLMPVHCYSPIPDLNKIKLDPCWDSKPGEIPGIDLNEAYQLNLLQTEFPKYVNEYNFPLEKNNYGNAAEFYFNNHMFANTDAEVYYCMIRHFKPQYVIEVGAGYSTQICCAGRKKNFEINKRETKILAIEPYPDNERLPSPVKEQITLIEKKVEQVDINIFQELNENDILFIDSSHVVRSGGDVNYLILEVLPRLNPGVVIHVHDICLPYEVAKTFIVDQGRFFTEEYLLQAFLTGNKDFEILWGTYFMSKKYPEKIAPVFRSSKEGKYAGGSFWIRRKK